MDAHHVVRPPQDSTAQGRAGSGARRLVGLALLAALLGASALSGCSGESSPTASQTPGTTPAAIAVQAGAGQTAPAGGALAVNPSFLVTDAEGDPVQGAQVSFAVTGGGGSIAVAQHSTGANGIATPGRWTLGPALGTNTLSATVVGHPALNTTLTATARLRRWTVMVYMAADNTLAVAGILDIDEMEAAGFDADVQLVVQAEFSPTALEQAGCGDPSCFNRPNWNTFRYAYAGTGSEDYGPNGSATDIGNRDMTDPAQLTEFIAWAKTTYPAEHYCLVLWNHGGGYVGLIEDQTSAADLMSVGELPAALAAAGDIDVLDFDMCLMGAYETLALLPGRADYVVFSEEVVPGDGNPYTEILDALQANSAMGPAAVAALIADQFHAAYAGDRASTTISVFDMAGYAAFASALDALATAFTADIADLTGAIGTAIPQTQAYAMVEIKDLVDFLDTVRPLIADATITGQIDALRGQATGSFRLRNHARTGTEPSASDVSASHGLSIVLPSGSANDQFSDEGPRSFAAYSALLPGEAWTEFLGEWLDGSGQVPVDYVDQGGQRVEVYLAWDPAAMGQDADVDLWVVEPSGELYIPYLGSVTPNGHFTADSYTDQVAFEGYFTNRYIEPGEYRFYANLYTDPFDFGPEYDILWRADQADDLSSLYAPNYPVLTKDVSWEADATPTWDEVHAGAYTDLQWAASLMVDSQPAPRELAPAPARPAAGGLAGHLAAPSASQLAMARAIVKEHRDQGWVPARHADIAALRAMLNERWR